LTKRNVRVLDSITAIRLRSGQFIGDSSTADHLIHEALDNAIDELQNGYGSTAGIAFSKTGEVLVFDEGRGLPTGKTINEATGEEIDSLEAIFTKLYSGGKFDLETSDLSQIGMNGVGLTVINALSEYVDVKTKMKHYRFVDSELKVCEKIETCPHSTEIIFKPNKKYFGSIKPNYEMFFNRVRLAQCKIPGSQFFFNNKKIVDKDLETFVREKLNIDVETPIYSCSYKSKLIKVVEADTGKERLMPGNITVYITYEEGDTILMSDVNLRFCDGTHLNQLQSLIKTILPTKLGGKYKNSPERFLIEGLRLYVSLQVPVPKFDSQTKTRMVSDFKNDLIIPLEAKLNKILGEKHIVETVERILSQKMGTPVKTSKSKRISSDNKLLDCIKKPGDVLYIVEGDSAQAVIRDARHTNTEASLPLRGKILNVEKSTLAKIKDNKEIKNIFEAIGQYPWRYDKVKIVCDADCRL